MKPDSGIYVVMADNGIGEFLWHKKDASPTPMCGSNFYTLMDKGDPDPIMSLELFSDFCGWAEFYLRNVPAAADPVGFDWDAFNQTGLSLALRLKSEWNDDIKVRYVRSPDDPARIPLEFTEIS